MFTYNECMAFKLSLIIVEVEIVRRRRACFFFVANIPGVLPIHQE